MSHTKKCMLVVSGLSIAVLSACSSSNPEQQEQTYYCGAQSIVVHANSDERIQLSLGGDDYQLERASAASGERYVSRDDESEVVFWSRGRSAELVIDGQSYPQCRQAGTLSESTVARGNEPFWSLTIGDDRMVLNRMGEDEVEYRIGDIEHSSRSTEIVDTSERVQVTISEELCQDSMSGMYFPQQAEVNLHGEQLNGCAGHSLSLLQGIEWRVEGLDNHDYSDHDVTLRFLHEEGESQVVGRSACNRYFGQYQLDGERLTVGQLAGTKMACSDESMRIEYQFLDALTKANSFTAERDNGGPLQINLNTDEGELRLRQQ